MADKKIPDTNKIDKLKDDLAKRVDAATQKNSDLKPASTSSAKSPLDKTIPEQSMPTQSTGGQRTDGRPQFTEPTQPASATGNVRSTVSTTKPADPTTVSYTHLTLPTTPYV